MQTLAAMRWLACAAAPTTSLGMRESVSDADRVAVAAQRIAEEARPSDWRKAEPSADEEAIGQMSE